MKVWFFCQTCRKYFPATLRPQLDAVFGNKQVHMCPECSRMVGAVEFDPAEISPDLGTD